MYCTMNITNAVFSAKWVFKGFKMVIKGWNMNKILYKSAILLYSRCSFPYKNDIHGHKNVDIFAFLFIISKMLLSPLIDHHDGVQLLVGEEHGIVVNIHLVFLKMGIGRKNMLTSKMYT